MTRSHVGIGDDIGGLEDRRSSDPCRGEGLGAEIARYQALGAPVAFSGVSRGMRFAYVDTSSMLGIMVELLEDVPSVRNGFALVADAGRNWDGTDPVRGLASAASAVT